MPFYIYIIQSQKDNSFYKGYTQDPVKRLHQHNSSESHYTSAKIPWVLVYVEEMPDKRTALIREINLKKATRQRIKALIVSDKNIVQSFVL